MKNLMYKLVLFLVPAMLFLSCEKDKFSEKDALEAQQTIDLLVTVVDASSSASPVTGATVNVIIGDKLVTQTTNDNGITIFTKVNIGGNAVVTVSKDAYTSVLTTVNTNPSSYRQSQVTAVVYLYSKDAAKVAVFRGRLTLESDLTNRKKEVAANVLVKAKNWNLGSSTEQVFTATTGADGKYEISVPVSSNNDYIELFYPEFTVNQKLAFVQENKSIAVAERSVLYKSDNSPQFDIPAIPSAYATIAAPTATSIGSGFALGAKANRVSLSSISSYYLLIDGGAGYNGGVTVANYLIPFTKDKGGVNNASLQVDITNGVITNIDGVVDNSATYDDAPTLNHSALATQPTTQANILLCFRTSYKLYISNKGSNYRVFPTVSAEADNYTSYVKSKRIDPNINDGSSQILGTTYLLDGYTAIVGGSIKSLTATADTIYTTTYLASAPTFGVINPLPSTATISTSTSSIGTDSSLVSITINTSGLGYDPLTPPVVTLTTLGDWGSGAVAKATVSTSTWLSNIYITSPGKKYVKNVNDYSNTGVTWSTSDSPSYPDNDYYGVKAGDIYVQDVYYGTGYQVINQTLNNK